MQLPNLISKNKQNTENSLFSASFIKNVVRLLKISYQEDKFLFIAYFATSALGALLLFVVYFIYKLMIDQVAVSANGISSTLFFVITTYLFFEYLSRFVNFTFNQYYFDYFIRTKLQNALTRNFMKKIGNMDFTNLENGEVRNLIGKVENTYAHRLPEIIHTLNAILYNLAALTFSLLIALRFNPVYFLILALVAAPVYYLRAKYGNLAWSTYATNASGANYLFYLRSLFTRSETLSEMKIYGLTNHFLKKTEEIQKKVLSDYQKPIAMYTALSTISFILIPVSIYFAISHFIGSGISQNIYTVGDFTFFLNILFTFSGQISSVLINIGSVSENSLFLSDYFALMDIENKTSNVRAPKFFDKIGPRRIVFEDVSFIYPGTSSYSLRNVNLTIDKGQDTAIVGHNGAGKSTLIKLLFRFYDPTSGRITVDGIDLKEIDIKHWYQHLGVLFQDYAKYYVSLEENISFGDIERAEKNLRLNRKRHIDDVEKALDKSHSLDLLKKLPNGYNQILGRWFDKGLELSGGQWQKVAIARALYRNSPILIVDEPTSAIDAESEARIFENLKSNYHNKNLLYISHRFSNVRMAHKIYVLSKGRVVEQGSHDDLLLNHGLYSEFFKLQKQGYE